MCKSVIREVVYYDSRISFYDTHYPLLENSWVDNVNIKIFGDSTTCVVLIDEATIPTDLEAFGTHLMGQLRAWGYDTRYVVNPIDIFKSSMNEMDLHGKYQENYATYQTEEFLRKCIKQCSQAVCSIICIVPREGSICNFVKVPTNDNSTIYLPKLVIGTIWNGAYDIYNGIANYDVKEYLQKLLEMNYGFLQFTDGTSIDRSLCDYIGNDILNKLWRDE